MNEQSRYKLDQAYSTFISKDLSGNTCAGQIWFYFLMDKV